MSLIFSKTVIYVKLNMLKNYVGVFMQDIWIIDDERELADAIAKYFAMFGYPPMLSTTPKQWRIFLAMSK